MLHLWKTFYFCFQGKFNKANKFLLMVNKQKEDKSWSSDWRLQFVEFDICLYLKKYITINNFQYI